MRTTTLCFLTKDDRVLLAMKKRGFGVGKWNGVGGKLREGEKIFDSAIREIQEEIGVGVALKDLKNVGTLKFSFDGNAYWEQECHVFVIDTWTGKPAESDEMRPRWYPIDALPFSEMWVDDPHWLPLVLAGKKISGKFLFSEKGDSLLTHEVKNLP